MEIVAKDLITGGVLTLAITIGASWSTIKIGLSSNKDDIGKICKSVKEITKKVDTMEANLKKEDDKTKELVRSFFGDGGPCDLRQKQCRDLVYSRFVDDHGRMLFVDKGEHAIVHEDIKKDLNGHKEMEKQIFSMLHQILSEVKNK